MWISDIAFVMFCLSHVTKKNINGTHWAKYSQIIDNFYALSGTLLLVLLYTIYLPHQLWRLFFAVWVLLTFIVVCRCIYPGADRRKEGWKVDRGQTYFLISSKKNLIPVALEITPETPAE